MNLQSVVTFVQFFFLVIIGLYFWNMLKSQQGNKVAVERESKKEIDKLRRMRAIQLSEPLSEKTRPTRFDDIVGQADGVKALRAALCGPNPQHVIIYGPPGVGKTAAARLVLEEAKKMGWSPFRPDAKFIELDATTARFDERGIADPLIGSVHDPIYQGAGPMGMAGIPQPKPGAVTKAHGGILFIDEIGELHPIQMNKLLKVLEDRKVFFESAYYNAEDPNIPLHIQDIFENGLPADFRLVGATTRQPQEIPPAIRSRCLEIYFRALLPSEVRTIAAQAAERMGILVEPGALDVIQRYATNGREAVNMVQIAAGVALTENRHQMTQRDVEWVVNSGQYNPRPEKKVADAPAVGLVNGLAIYGPNLGTLLEVEAVAHPGHGKIEVTGVVDEEELGTHGRTIRRRSLARSSVDNVVTVLKNVAGVDPDAYDLHINFPGGVPLDGPSAGIAIAVACYSAIMNRPVDNRLAMTGELSIRGHVKPVGGVVAKVEAAMQAGCTRVLIPRDNWQDLFSSMGIEVIPVDRLTEVLELAVGTVDEAETPRQAVMEPGLLTASSVPPSTVG
ncbi:Endopeptidase La [Sulfobacillus acidophilus TPY]|uniref:endopeptidase La n=1 Tax=Sulfobacillus acidophilus (strain ATCC 700253 / DSM 10332 / NAL) TaxID=679936 RepID=G8U0X0_SULAD|nr:Endopeptidase La [Sulfobacillus acidophilus TPY]AEW06515.1 anti-sigma H sporulation factor, LonB [Sulfobacillus acidophilus DSM 10332]